jgi:hypothetical protein
MDNKYRNVLDRKYYRIAKSSGMLKVFHPELTGNWEVDSVIMQNYIEPTYKTITPSDIVCIKYNGTCKPTEVSTKDGTVYDIFRHRGEHRVTLVKGRSSSVITSRPAAYSHFTRHSVWFVGKGRPIGTNGKHLTDSEIMGYGYNIRDVPVAINEIASLLSELPR